MKTTIAISIISILTIYTFYFFGLFNIPWYGFVICFIILSAMFELIAITIEKNYVRENGNQLDSYTSGSAFIFFLFFQAIIIIPLSIYKMDWDREKLQQQILTTKMPQLEKQFNIKLTSKEAKCDFVKFPFVLVGFLEDRGDKVQVVILKNNLKCMGENVEACYCRNVGDIVLIDKEHFIPGKSTFLITEGNILLNTNKGVK